MILDNIFGEQPLREQSFLRRLIGSPDPENGYIAVRNLLATRSVDELHEGHVSDALRTHGVKFPDIARLRAIYAEAVAAFAADDRFDSAETAALERLQRILGLADSDRAAVAISLYTDRIRSALTDHVLTEEEKSSLDRVKVLLRVDERVAAERYIREASVVLRDGWAVATHDHRISPEEERELNALASSLGIDVLMDQQSRENLERCRWRWRIENGILPEYSVPLNLQRGERCHFIAHGARVAERRTVTRGYVHSGLTARVKIVKGLYWHAGSARVERITQDVLREVDSGTFYVTSKRVILRGQKKNMTIPYRSVLSITPYADAVEIEKTSGRDPVFFFSDVEFGTMILSAAMRAASN